MKEKTLYKVCRSGIFAAIICALSFINFPLGAVPASLATLGVILAGAVLSPLEAVGASLAYIFLGVIGLPVFSNGGAGAGVLFSLTGGYIWSYPILAFLVSLNSIIPYKRSKVKIISGFVLSLIGVTVCYALGTVQYMMVCDASFFTALTVCVIPFIPIDIVKSAVGILIGNKIRSKIKAR